MMMNGPMMEQAVGGQSGSFLAGVLEQTMLLSQRRRIDPATTVINQLFLAALSRPPTSREVARAKAMVSMYPDQLNVMEDLFWALLNSNEFVLNH